MSEVPRALLKRYMLHVYKWTGNFQFDNGEDAIFDDSPDGKLMQELRSEVESRADNLAENITEGTQQA